MSVIGAFRPEVSAGIHFTIAAVLPVKQTVETGGTVTAGKTQPVNRSAAGHERTRTAVADQRIVVNGRIGIQWGTRGSSVSGFDVEPVIFPPAPTPVQFHHGKPLSGKSHGSGH